MEIVINGKVVNVEVDNVIHCNTEEKANTLLQGLKYSGFLWISGEPLGCTNYHIYGENTCYRININEKITYGDVVGFEKSENANIKIISYDDLLNQVKLSWSNSEVNELWEAVRAVACSMEDGGLTYDECLEIFDGMLYSKAIMVYSPEYFLNKYKEWKEKQIVCGDIIKGKYTENEYLVFNVNNFEISAINEEGKYCTIPKIKLIDYEKVRSKTIENLFS